MDLLEIQRAGERIVARHPWEVVRTFAVCDLLLNYNNQLSTEQSVLLDIGCGDIYWSERASAVFKHAEIIAFDAAMTDEMVLEYKKTIQRKGLPIKLVRSLKEAESEIQDPVSVVLLLDVLEHIDDDAEFLRTLSSFSKIGKDTVFMITVPAFQVLFSSHDVRLKHYRRYSRKILADKMRSSGFELITSGYLFSVLVIARLLLNIQEKVFPGKKMAGIEEWKPSRIRDHLLKIILTIDYKLSVLLHKLGIVMPGLSVYAICKKSS